MRDLLELDSSLNNKTVVYRTLDFFGAASIVTNRQLMFSRADTFSDKNEGVDRLLAQLESSMPNSGCGMGWHDQETARRLHAHVKRSHFISCWSTNPESVAMWSLYSPDYCSVRISTTVAKLRVVIENLLEKYSFLRLTEENIGQRAIIATHGRIAPVTYAPLAYILQRVSRRANAHLRLAARYARKGQNMPAIGDISPRYWQRKKQREFQELRTTCNLKDMSFQHEAEIRLAVRLGEETVSKRMLEEQAFRDPNHKYHALWTDIARLWGLVETMDLPEREFVNCPADLVEAVAIDPRCPPHKAIFIRNWFYAHHIPIVESTCFGYVPDSFNVFPEW